MGKLKATVLVCIRRKYYIEVFVLWYKQYIKHKYAILNWIFDIIAGKLEVLSSVFAYSCKIQLFGKTNFLCST